MNEKNKKILIVLIILIFVLFMYLVNYLNVEIPIIKETVDSMINIWLKW